MPATARPMSVAKPMMWATGSAITASSRCRRVGHSTALGHLAHERPVA